MLDLSVNDVVTDANLRRMPVSLRQKFLQYFAIEPEEDESLTANDLRIRVHETFGTHGGATLRSVVEASDAVSASTFESAQSDLDLYDAIATQNRALKSDGTISDFRANARDVEAVRNRCNDVDGAVANIRRFAVLVPHSKVPIEEYRRDMDRSVYTATRIQDPWNSHAARKGKAGRPRSGSRDGLTMGGREGGEDPHVLVATHKVMHWIDGATTALTAIADIVEKHQKTKTLGLMALLTIAAFHLEAK